MTAPGLSVEDRIWMKIDVRGTDDCWPWLASTRKGYGQVNVGGGVIRDSHRVIYEMIHGQIEEGMVVDHDCHTTECTVPWAECPHRACCNPSHLVARSPRANTLRGNSPSAKCAVVTHCPSGHPYDEGNTHISRGKRQCRACWPDKNRRSRDAKKVRDGLHIAEPQ